MTLTFQLKSTAAKRVKLAGVKTELRSYEWGLGIAFGLPVVSSSSSSSSSPPSSPSNSSSSSSSSTSSSSSPVEMYLWANFVSYLRSDEKQIYIWCLWLCVFPVTGDGAVSPKYRADRKPHTCIVCGSAANTQTYLRRNAQKQQSSLRCGLGAGAHHRRAWDKRNRIEDEMQMRRNSYLLLFLLTIRILREGDELLGLLLGLSLAGGRHFGSRLNGFVKQVGRRYRRGSQNRD